LKFTVPDPDLQIDFATKLAEFRELFLQEALGNAVRNLPVPEIDKELAAHVPAASLSALASHGLRGEMVFPVPVVLTCSPRLLGYYRLLYGYSQKEFYSGATGLTPFKRMEDRGVLAPRNAPALAGLCDSLCEAGSLLVAGIGAKSINAGLLSDLTMLTLGPQLRGGANVRRGTAGIRTVFNVIQDIVQAPGIKAGDKKMEFLNAAGRKIVIQFAPDPDIVIQEEMRPGQYRKLIAIEVKAGSDFSNIHNRIGEAEKSHQKARLSGFSECWTVVNVDKVDLALAHQESPTTNRFYTISTLVRKSGAEYQDFQDRILSLSGIKKKRRVVKPT